MSMDDDYEVVIALDGETVKRLARVSRLVGVHPRQLAAQLLRDVLKDAAMIEAGLTEGTHLN